jgi:hypothetical protein
MLLQIFLAARPETLEGRTVSFIKSDAPNDKLAGAGLPDLVSSQQVVIEALV